jgi:hypothetical protein
MNYRSVCLAISIVIGEKSSISCLISRHLDEKLRDCKQRIRQYLVKIATTVSKVLYDIISAERKLASNWGFLFTHTFFGKINAASQKV